MDKKMIVIEKARNLFSKYGYTKVSMDEIAREANVTKKTIYSYFKDKETLFRYFIEEDINKMKNDIEEKEKSNMPFIDIVSSSIYEMLLFKKNSNLATTLSNEISNKVNNDNSKDLLKIYDNEIVNYIESRIKKAIDAKLIKNCDAHLTAFIIYKVYIAVMFEYDFKLDEKKIALEVTSILKEGLFN